MNEVSGNILGLYRRVATELGVTMEDLFGGTGVPIDRDVERFDWDALCVANERIAAIARRRGESPAEVLTRMGTMVFDVSTMRRAWSIVRWVASPKMVYWASHVWGGPSMFNHLIDLASEDMPDGRLRLHIGVPATHRDSPEFFHLNRGVFQAMPRLLGQPDARVDLEICNRSCTFMVELPETQTVWAVVKNRLRYVVSARDALEELSLQHRELEARYRDLFAAREAAERARTEAERAQREAETARDLAERALIARSNFLAVVGHEIRTPIHCILGMSELLGTTTLDDEQQDYLRMLRTGGESLRALIDDVLDMSKLEAGKMSIELCDVNLGRLVREVIDIACPASKTSTEVSMTWHVDPRLPSLVRADEVRLRQVLTNLVGNAVKFTSQGSIAVRVTRAVKDEIRFEVSDTGIGISREQQGKLFQPFSQADSSTTRKYGGTGLGLAISKQLVEMFGGTIGLESALGKGTTFWFVIPLHASVERLPLPAQRA